MTPSSFAGAHGPPPIATSSAPPTNVGSPRSTPRSAPARRTSASGSAGADDRRPRHGSRRDRTGRTHGRHQRRARPPATVHLSRGRLLSPTREPHAPLRGPPRREGSRL